METEVLDGGRLIVARSFLPLLRAARLDTFEAVMAAPVGQLRRDFPGRRTSRLELRRADGSTQWVYLKRYHPEYLSAGRRILRRLGWPGAGDEAREEWEAVCRVADLGIPTLDLIARGQDRPNDHAVQRSFLMTAELVGAEEGHHFAATLGWTQRRRLLRRAADLTRQLHGAGLVHKDLYLCHYMARPTPDTAPPDLHLIDLQRMAHPRFLAERWRVKDLAALVYSSLKAGATTHDIAAAFRDYRNGDRLDRSNRDLARRVLRRVDWLRTRTPKHDTDFQQLK